MKRMEKEWLSYEHLVLKGFDPRQIKECRRAFYGGAQALFGEVMSLLGPEDTPTEQEVLELEAIQIELDEFCKKAEQGLV